LTGKWTGVPSGGMEWTVRKAIVIIFFQQLDSAISMGLLRKLLNQDKIFPWACDQWFCELGKGLATYGHTPKALGHAVIQSKNDTKMMNVKYTNYW